MSICTDFFCRACIFKGLAISGFHRTQGVNQANAARTGAKSIMLKIEGCAHDSMCHVA